MPATATNTCEMAKSVTDVARDAKCWTTLAIAMAFGGPTPRARGVRLMWRWLLLNSLYLSAN